MNKKEKKALDMRINIFDGIAFDFIEAWRKQDYIEAMRNMREMEDIFKRAKEVIREEKRL